MTQLTLSRLAAMWHLKLATAGFSEVETERVNKAFSVQNCFSRVDGSRPPQRSMPFGMGVDRRLLVPTRS